ncbi:MAG: Rid family hydrolase, partial [Sphingomonas sp.]
MAGTGATLSTRSGDARASLRESRIERYEVTTPGIDVPRISYAVARGDMVYTAGVTPHLANGDRVASLGDIKSQTRQVLGTIDRLLAMAGTNKSNLLTAQVWLTDMRHFTAHCDAWNEWVDPANP